jgi:hypothetical protein
MIITSVNININFQTMGMQTLINKNIGIYICEFSKQNKILLNQQHWQLTNVMKLVLFDMLYAKSTKN